MAAALRIAAEPIDNMLAIAIPDRELRAAILAHVSEPADDVIKGLDQGGL
jgi:hypothetical protein